MTVISVQPMQVEKMEEEADNAPMWYAILPVIPLALILSFSSLWITTIKMNIVMAMFIGLTIGVICEYARCVTAIRFWAIFRPSSMA